MKVHVGTGWPPTQGPIVTCRPAPPTPPSAPSPPSPSDPPPHPRLHRRRVFGGGSQGLADKKVLAEVYGMRSARLRSRPACAHAHWWHPHSAVEARKAKTCASIRRRAIKADPNSSKTRNVDDLESGSKGHGVVRTEKQCIQWSRSSSVSTDTTYLAPWLSGLGRSRRSTSWPCTSASEGCSSATILLAPWTNAAQQIPAIFVRLLLGLVEERNPGAGNVGGFYGGPG